MLTELLVGEGLDPHLRNRCLSWYHGAVAHHLCLFGKHSIP